MYRCIRLENAYTVYKIYITTFYYLIKFNFNYYTCTY